MAQISQACSYTTAQDTSSYSELVTGEDSYTREHQEKTELVTGIRYVHIIGWNQARASRKNLKLYIFLSSVAGDWLQNIKIHLQVCYSAILRARNELVNIVGPTLQKMPVTGSTCPPLQETDPSCSGVMNLNNCDIVVQR